MNDKEIIEEYFKTNDNYSLVELSRLLNRSCIELLNDDTYKEYTDRIRDFHKDRALKGDSGAKFALKQLWNEVI